MNQLSATANLLCAVASGLVWASVTSTAQTFTVLKSFGNLTNTTGFAPRSQLVHGPDGTLYGTTSQGDASDTGTVFKIQPDGSGFAVLKRFTNALEGQSPHAGLALSGNVDQHPRRGKPLHQCHSWASAILPAHGAW